MPSHDRQTCKWCTTADREGWWGDSDISHCRVCGETWPQRSTFVHCVICHRTFSNHSSLALHKALNNECLDPAELVKSNGDKVFGEPRPAKYGVLIWRKASGANPWLKSS
jgi:hypothetical protein